jgi:hypothetical protein
LPGIEQGIFDQVAQLPLALKKALTFMNPVDAMITDSRPFVRPTPIGPLLVVLAVSSQADAHAMHPIFATHSSST